MNDIAKALGGLAVSVAGIALAIGIGMAVSDQLIGTMQTIERALGS